MVWNQGMEGRMKSERNPLGAGGATAFYRRWDTDEVAGWILGAFPSIFQNEAGDPYHFKLAKPDLVTWGPHLLRSRNCLGRLLVRVE